MRYFVILYRNASGQTALTREQAVSRVEDIRMTDFVRANFIGIYEVPNPYEQA